MPLQGQFHQRIAHTARDPLTVNAVALAQGDDEPVVLVSVDVVAFPNPIMEDVQARCAAAHGLNPRRVLLGGTHTHLGPIVINFIAGDEPDAAWLEQVKTTITRCVGAAIADLEPATLWTGQGWLKEMGWNRRGVRRDGSTHMYYGSWNEDFVGVEGPRDGDVPVILARRLDGSAKVVVTGFATHPNTREGDEFYSADYVAQLRAALRQQLGPDLHVVYFTGAAGNTAPTIMENNSQRRQPWRGEAGLVRSGNYLAAEVLKVIASIIDPVEAPQVTLKQAALSIGYRPWPATFDFSSLKGNAQKYYSANHADWPRRLREEPPSEVRVNVLRLGPVAFCTNPAELYVEHGLAIKQQSPAGMTFIAELTDGYCGYVPTVAAFGRGGYDTWPGPTSKLAHDAGDQIVATTRRLLAEAFA